MSSGLFVAGLVIVIGGLAYGASIATNWAVVSAVVLIGFIILTGASTRRQKVS
jgi:hypothetical protein